MAHVRMMAAAQPFLSGAISKTVNLPNEATVDDVREIYEEGWKLGLKAVALYRDGCKASQPLSTSNKEQDEKESSLATSAAAAPVPAALVRPEGERVRLPKKRSGFTQEAQRRRTQGVPAHGRVRGRVAGRDLHRHAQGGRCLPLADELLRHGRVRRPAVRRAARDLRRAVHVHPLRAARRGRRTIRTSSSRPRSSTTSSACSAWSTCSATTSRR